MERGEYTHPLDLAIVIIAAYHLPIGDLSTCTVHLRVHLGITTRILDFRDVPFVCESNGGLRLNGGCLCARNALGGWLSVIVDTFAFFVFVLVLSWALSAGSASCSALGVGWQCSIGYHGSGNL